MMYNNVIYQIASNANNKISIPPAAVGVRTYTMDGDIQYIHTTCMHAWSHVAKACAVQLAKVEGIGDANDHSTIEDD
jgi:hypothetical protein